MKRRTTAFWLEALERGDIPVQRMNTLDDIVADPHLKAIDYLHMIDHPRGRIRALAVPSEWSDSKPEYRRHAPRLGEHTREILREAGFSTEKIERLISDGVAKPWIRLYNPRRADLMISLRAPNKYR